MVLSLNERLVAGAAALGVELGAGDAGRLLELTAELARCNQKVNLTAITAPEAMLTHHLLDSLAVAPHLHGVTVADVGTGAGFPGLPLALVNPQRQFTLIDSNSKKIRFVSHAVQLLGLTNVTALHARAEQLRVPHPVRHRHRARIRPAAQAARHGGAAVRAADPRARHEGPAPRGGARPGERALAGGGGAGACGPRP